MLTSNYFDCRRVSLELVLTEASANILQDFFHKPVIGNLCLLCFLVFGPDIGSSEGSPRQRRRLELTQTCLKLFEHHFIIFNNTTCTA